MFGCVLWCFFIHICQKSYRNPTLKNTTLKVKMEKLSKTNLHLQICLNSWLVVIYMFSPTQSTTGVPKNRLGFS
jgi:hypothetical protein